MVIAHIITRLLRAGSEENTIATCLAQASDGHEVFLIHGDESSPAQIARCGTAVKVIGIPHLVHQTHLSNDIKAVRTLAKLLREIRPAVVHTHQSKAGIVGRYAARLAQVPTIVHGVHIVPFASVGRGKKLMYLAAERAVAGFTNAFINVSEGTRQLCLAHRVGRPEQHFVAHSGFEVERFRNAAWPEDWRTLCHVGDREPKPPTILMLAALEPRKRHVEFVQVVGRIARRVPELRVLLAGEGPMRPAVEAAIAQLGLHSTVRLLGFNASPEKLVALADITVLTSMREGLPRVIVQAIAGGKPVVTTELPGVADVIQSGVNGLITPADDLRFTADAIADLLSDPERLLRMQNQARQTDVSSWRTDTMCATVSAIYDRVIPSTQRVAADARPC